MTVAIPRPARKVRCREATVESDAHDHYLRGLYTFCKAAKGDWQFRTAGVKQKAKQP